MNFKGHLYSALVGIVCILYAHSRYGIFPEMFATLKPIDYVFMSFLFILYALIPDIDTASIIENYFFSAVIGVIIGLLVVGKYFLASIVGLLSLLTKIGHHRGFTHAYWFGVIISAPFALYSVYYFWAAMAGFVLHKVGDSC